MARGPDTDGPADHEPAVAINHLDFAYPSCPSFVQDCSLSLPKGSRCLLIGANGAGKTTLLQLLAGKYMVDKKAIAVLGMSPFFDLGLTCSGQLAYLGTSWRKDVAFAGYGVPLQGDISAGKMIFGVEGVDPERRARLIRLLDIDLYQRMTTMSDGQRRRVQICMGLLKPYDVLLMDEITVDMDVVGRQDLLAFFEQECAERGATIVYATHIFDGLEDWITHVAYLEDGQLRKVGIADAVVGNELRTGKKLLDIVEGWLRDEKRRRLEKKAAAAVPNGASAAEPETSVKPKRTPFMPSKHLAFFK